MGIRHFANCLTVSNLVEVWQLQRQRAPAVGQKAVTVVQPAMSPCETADTHPSARVGMHAYISL